MEREIDRFLLVIDLSSIPNACLYSYIYFFSLDLLPSYLLIPSLIYSIVPSLQHEMELWDAEMAQAATAAAAAVASESEAAAAQDELLGRMRQWDSRSQEAKLSAKNGSSGRPVEDGSVALER